MFLTEGSLFQTALLPFYSGPIRQDRNQSSLSWFARPSRSCPILAEFIYYPCTAAARRGVHRVRC